MKQRLTASFFQNDVLEVAPQLLGKKLVRVFPNGQINEFLIVETEAYRGEEDIACHASKGRTARTEVMYLNGGHIYVYLIYGMYWMLNFVTSVPNNPQAVLIRAIEGFSGPGKLTKHLQIDKSFNNENLEDSNRIYVTEYLKNIKYKTAPRIGIDYAGDYWKNVPWRFILETD
jgi:DNA-3-methyladenine glycosylase